MNSRFQRNCVNPTGQPDIGVLSKIQTHPSQGVALSPVRGGEGLTEVDSWEDDDVDDEQQEEDQVDASVEE